MQLGVALVGVAGIAYGLSRVMSRYGSPFPRGTAFRVTSRVGPRTSPIDGTPVNHDGVDLGAPEGTPILSVSAGTVRAVYYSSSGGNVVEVQEDRGIRWLYLHQSHTVARKGQQVRKGDLLGHVGSTGRSTGPHLHLEANDAAGNVLDPIALGVPV